MRPATRILFAIGLIAAAFGAEADSTIVIHRQPIDPALRSAAGEQTVARTAAEDSVPARRFLIPYYEVNMLDSSSRVTLLSVRNESAGPAVVDVEILPLNSDVPYVTRVVDLDPRQTFTANLRDHLAGQSGVPTGMVRGWVRVTSQQPISVDYARVSPDEAYATGGTAVDEATGLCERYKTRYLIGGPFSGGTQLVFWITEPHGGDPATDPPTLTGSVFDEAGNFINDFAFYTDSYANEISAERLVTGGHFGSIDVHFLTAGGGYAGATLDASGKYSVGLDGYCLDAVAAP